MFSIVLYPVFYGHKNVQSKGTGLKTGFYLIIVHFYIRGKLFIIRCDKFCYLIKIKVLHSKSKVSLTLSKHLMEVLRNNYGLGIGIQNILFSSYYLFDNSAFLLALGSFIDYHED